MRGAFAARACAAPAGTSAGPRVVDAGVSRRWDCPRAPPPAPSLPPRPSVVLYTYIRTRRTHACTHTRGTREQSWPPRVIVRRDIRRLELPIRGDHRASVCPYVRTEVSSAESDSPDLNRCTRRPGDDRACDETCPRGSPALKLLLSRPTIHIAPRKKERRRDIVRCA